MSKIELTEAQLKDAARLKAIYEAKKIEARSKGKKISQESIAADCGWTQGAVGHFLNGRTALSLESAIKLAESLQVPVSDFSPSLAKQLSGDNFTVKGKSKFKKAPILNYVQAGAFCEYFDDAIIEEGAPYNTELHGDDCFWVVIEGDSMISDFYPKDMVLISPSRQPKAGDFVIALKKGEDSTTFKKWRPRGFDEQTGREYYELVPSNDDYAVIDSRFTPFEICGVAVEHNKLLT